MSRPLPLHGARPPCDHGRSAKKTEEVELRDVTTGRAAIHQFIECLACGATRRRRKSFAGVTRWSAWRIPRPGVCYRCGCTEDRACEDGCGWANEQKTVCTSCVAT